MTGITKNMNSILLNDYTVIIIEGKFYTSEKDMYLVGGNMKKGLFENL